MDRLKAICKNEHLEIDDQTLKRLLASAGGGDLRQIINILQMWKNRQRSSELSVDDFISKVEKDDTRMITNYDAAWRLLNFGEKPDNLSAFPTFRHKLDLFFID